MIIERSDTMSFSLNIGGLRLLNIEVYKNNELVYKGLSDNAPDEIKKLSGTKIEGISPMKIFVEENKN